jgi:hypothetical protein
MYLGKSHISASFLSIPGPDPWDLPMKQISLVEEKTVHVVFKYLTRSLRRYSKRNIVYWTLCHGVDLM